MTTTEADIKRAHLGVTLAFLSLGLSAGNFVSRIPDLKSKLELSNSVLGVSLLMMSLGVLVALGPVGKLAGKHGSAATLNIATASLILVAPFIGLANSAVTLSAALFFFGITVAFDNKRPSRALIFGSIFILVIYFSFTKFLNVALPAGILEGIL